MYSGLPAYLDHTQDTRNAPRHRAQRSKFHNMRKDLPSLPRPAGRQRREARQACRHSPAQQPQKLQPPKRRLHGKRTARRRHHQEEPVEGWLQRGSGKVWPSRLLLRLLAPWVFFRVASGGGAATREQHIHG